MNDIISFSLLNTKTSELINASFDQKILLIISELANKEKSIMLIEHDFDAIMRICNRVIFMDVGKNICEGTPEQVRNDPRVIEAYIN